jgi:hypothetical protein
MARKLDLHMQPAGVTADALFEIRKAMRALRRAEKRIQAHHRAEQRRLERTRGRP